MKVQVLGLSQLCIFTLIMLGCMINNHYVESFQFRTQLIPFSIPADACQQNNKLSMSWFGFGAKPAEVINSFENVSRKDKRWIQSRVDSYNRGGILASDFIQTASKNIKDLAPAIEFAASLINDAKKRSVLQEALENFERNRNLRIAGISSNQIGDRYELRASGTYSSSGRSRILNAIDKSSPTLILKAKISKDLICIQREIDNWKLVRNKEGGKQSKLFVDFTDFQYSYDSSKNNAILMENGSYDLKRFVQIKGPIRDKELRKAAVKIAKIVDGFHRAGLVWTDCKPENLVVFSNNQIKGIDFEGAIPTRSKLLSFSPEITAPYIAQQSLFTALITPKFDTWSYGMVLYHLYVGKSYYDGLAPSQIVSRLKSPSKSGAVDLSKIEDSSLKSLLELLFVQEEKDTITVGEALRRHPYLALPIF